MVATMNWTYRAQQWFSLSASESAVLLTLGGLLALGVAVRYVRAPDALDARDLYAEADRALLEATAVADSLPPADPVLSDVPLWSRVEAVLPPVFPLDLNAAGAEDLEELPRIGPALAARIVAHRRANGPFRSVRDLLDVKGIGEKTLAHFDTLVTVGGGTDVQEK